ncbi:MAG: (Fe-S)-binding protein [Myxococcales bacterium]|nr:(Fe-S)-binding protein [Myxococcales bacterium]
MAGDCRYCGECLNRCVYLKLSLADAGAEMRRLDAGEATPRLDAGCISCAACNLFCRYGAKPYDRILEKFHGNYLAHGLPERAKFLLPTRTPNFRTYILDRLPPDERDLVEKWERAEPEGDVLYPGCNLITSAYLTQSGVFDDLTIAGSLALCCGEMYYRMGLPDVVRRIAERLTEYYAGKSIRRMVFVCPAGLNMFRHILPEKFGARFDFPTVYFTDYLLERLDRGELQPVRYLTGSLLVHDSCHGRLLGESLTGSVRELLRRLGVEPVNPPHTAASGYCCGIAAAAPRQSAGDLLRAVSLPSLEYFRAGGEQVGAYCTGCYLTLGSLQGATGLGKPVRHVLELVAEAIGRPVPDRLGERTRLLLRGIVANTLPAYASPRRFWMGKPTV